MTTPTAGAAPRKKRRIGRIITIVLAILIIPLVVGYFVVTSTVFLKRVILPQAGASMNSSITISDATIRPFSQVVFKDFEIKPNGKETLFKAAEVRARYSLRDIIGGKITIHEVTVLSPVVTIVEAADGSSNLDPITQDSAPKPGKKKEKKPEQPPNLNIKNISLKNALVQHTKHLEGGGRETTEISNLDFTLDQLINGQPGKMTVAADIRVDRVPSANTTNAAPGSLRGKLDGRFDYKLTADIQPESAKGNLRFDVLEATGDMADLAKLAAIVNCDLTPSDIRQLSLNFEQAGQPLGELSASGPFSFANTEGKLKVKLSSIDRRVLNLVGAAKGIDFNATVINAENDLVISQKGTAISINGQINANKLSLTKKAENQTTPTLELAMTYQLSVDQNAKSALIQKFELNGTQNQQKFLRGSISRPMTISWGETSSAPEDATLQLAITDLNLADWKSFLGEIAPSGKVNATVDVVSAQAGKELSFDVNSRIESLSAKFGSNQISNADIELKTKATITDTNKVSLASYSVRLSQGNQPALTLSGSGTLNLETEDADIKATMDGALAPLFKIVVVSDLNATAGVMKFDGQITQRKDLQTVKGNFALTDFSGSYAGSPLDRFGAKFDADLEMNQQDLQIRKLSGDLQQAGKAGGNFDVKGNYNLESKTGNIEMKIVEMNQNALRPFLAKSLGEKQLVTISVNGNTTAHLQENESSFKGNIDLKNFVVRDPKKAKADDPLAAQVQLDGAMRKEIFDLKQFQVTLSPTARAKNQLNITGQLDLSKTNAMKGKLLMQSDAFDVTPFYDLYAAQPQPTNAAAAPGQTAPQTTPPSNEESEPMNLPVEQIIAEINIGQFYLREIEIKDWRGTAKVEGSRVLLNPFQLSLNGAPVKLDADLDIGVKGYAYNFSVSLDGVPLEPLANSFISDQRGAYKGTIIANAKIKGAGTTGVNLKKTLNGQADFSFTNANIQIVGKRLKPFLTTVALVLQTPELTSSPVEWVTANLKFSDGKIDLQNLQMQSDAFTANTKGQIPIADVFTNSPLGKMPINFGLSYSLARKARLTSTDTPTNSAYVMLPAFLRARGTLGDPKPDIDEAKLLGTALQKFGDRIPGVDEKTGNVLKGLGGILGGQTATNTNATNVTTNQPATNPPATNQPLNIDNVLDFFKKKK